MRRLAIYTLGKALALPLAAMSFAAASGAAGASPDLYDVAWTARVGSVAQMCGWRSLPWNNLVTLAKLHEAQGGLPHSDGHSYPSPPFSWTAQGAVRMVEAAGWELTRRYRRFGVCGTLIGLGDVAAADRAIASLPAEVRQGNTGAYRMSNIPPGIMGLGWRTEGVHLAVRCGLRSEEWKRRLLIATRRDIAAEINRPETPGPYPLSPSRTRELNGFVDGMLAMTERIASKEIEWDATLACAAARANPSYAALDGLDDKIAREEYAASKRR